MAQIINHSFDTIPKSYLFSEVARRVAAFRAGKGYNIPFSNSEEIRVQKRRQRQVNP